nr:MAG TPA: Lipopolysaccharide assembly protein A domain [Caudoviricetes sp.]
MPETIVVGLLSLAGTLIGTVSGILTANKLSNYRIGQLEKRVAEHNNVIRRTYQLEGRMTEAEHDIRDLKQARSQERSERL